jgi:hypothetical protein
VVVMCCVGDCSVWAELVCGVIYFCSGGERTGLVLKQRC